MNNTTSRYTVYFEPVRYSYNNIICTLKLNPNNLGLVGECYSFNQLYNILLSDSTVTIIYEYETSGDYSEVSWIWWDSLECTSADIFLSSLQFKLSYN